MIWSWLLLRSSPILAGLRGEIRLVDADEDSTPSWGWRVLVEIWRVDDSWRLAIDVAGGAAYMSGRSPVGDASRPHNTSCREGVRYRSQKTSLIRGSCRCRAWVTIRDTDLVT